MGSLGGILETSWAVLAKFLSRLGPQLGSILDPKMALELPKSRPRGAYRTPKRPLGAKNHPKAAQSPPKPPREVPRPPLSLDFRGSTVAGTRLCRAEDICVMEIGFRNEEKKLRWGLSTRVLNFVGGTKKNHIIIIGPFSRGGLEKPNPARTIDTLADGS